MPWRGGRPSVAAMTPQECNSTQVPPPLLFIFMPKRACFCPIYHSICSKNAISAYMFQKWPGKIKYKKKIQTFWRRLWLRGIQTPLPPWRGVGGRVFENLPYTVTRHLEHDVNQPLDVARKWDADLWRWRWSQGLARVPVQPAHQPVPQVQKQLRSPKNFASSLKDNVVPVTWTIFKCTVQKVHNM